MNKDESENTKQSTGASADKESPREDAEQKNAEHKEPSLGPACLVICILGLAAVCAFCGIGSWFMFYDQYPMAEDGIREQLIPWVKQSQLATEDKDSIVKQLNDLIPKLQQKTINKEQLLRLRNCLTDNPVLLWGGVQSIQAQAAESDLSDVEKQTLERLTQRLMRMAAERELSRNNIEFALQPCAKVREDQMGLEVLPNLTSEQIRDFMTRSEQLVNNSEIPNQAYDKTPREAFGILIDAALDLNGQ
jgi:hypothetical protein